MLQVFLTIYFKIIIAISNTCRLPLQRKQSRQLVPIHFTWI